ncbi:MAG: hypothetical protein ACKV2Q_15820 [Planctomycetaceae bacterium]
MALAVGEDLAPAEIQELQRHLQDCLSCQKTWEQQQRGFAVLQHSRTVETRPQPESVWPTISQRLRERGIASERGEFNGWIAALAVTAACVLLFVFSREDSVSVASRTQRGRLSAETLVSHPDDSGQTGAPVLRQDAVKSRRP